MTMTVEEAREELMKRFPGQSVSATCQFWFFKQSKNKEDKYSMSYNFYSQGCSTKEGSSFEDCFAQLDKENESLNKEISKYSIILRKFDLNAV